MTSSLARASAVAAWVGLVATAAMSQSAKFCLTNVLMTCCEGTGKLDTTRMCRGSPCPDVPVGEPTYIWQVRVGSEFEYIQGPPAPSGSCEYYIFNCGPNGCYPNPMARTASCAIQTGAGTCGGDLIAD